MVLKAFITSDISSRLFLSSMDTAVPLMERLGRSTFCMAERKSRSGFVTLSDRTKESNNIRARKAAARTEKNLLNPPKVSYIMLSGCESRIVTFSDGTEYVVRSIASFWISVLKVRGWEVRFWEGRNVS